MLFSGCAFHKEPFITYEEKGHALSDTAVFDAGQMEGIALAQIPKVNGVETSCWQVGCPIWVRVLPGTNTFRIRYSLFNNGIASHLVGETDVVVEKMLPRHVYKASYTVNGNRFSVSVADLGENPKFRADLSFGGAN
jgi:hypothetical protein